MSGRSFLRRAHTACTTTFPVQVLLSAFVPLLPDVALSRTQLLRGRVQVGQLVLHVSPPTIKAVAAPTTNGSLDVLPLPGPLEPSPFPCPLDPDLLALLRQDRAVALTGQVASDTGQHLTVAALACWHDSVRLHHACQAARQWYAARQS